MSSKNNLPKKRDFDPIARQARARRLRETTSKKNPRFLFAFHASARNIGDRECSPVRHLEFPNSATSQISPRMESADTIVFGGGLILGSIKKIAEKGVLERYRRAIVWGIGIGNHKAIHSAWYNEVKDKIAAFSTREYSLRDEVDFVPCASCLATEFDQKYEQSHEVVMYLHRKKTDVKAFEDCNLPEMYNIDATLSEALKFIASGETVVTNSYHGIYWAQLLGKRVLALPYSEKFFGFQDMPSIATQHNWKNNLHLAKAYPSRLEEYRERNLIFMEKAFGLEMY